LQLVLQGALLLVRRILAGTGTIAARGSWRPRTIFVPPPYQIEADMMTVNRHASHQGWITIVFSDIEGYSDMNERMGDEATHEVLRRHRAIVRAAVKAHRGLEVKSQGDGFMLAFSDAPSAVSCAASIQRAIAAQDFWGEEVKVRIGVHTGEVIAEADDFFGRTVILAARVADCARGGEVLVTGEVHESVPGASFGEGRQVCLKGIRGTRTVYSAFWRT
jgi:class 3 adenylate cyclase